MTERPDQRPELVYAAIFDLDSAAEWIVLGAIVLTAVGTVIAVQSR